MKKILITLFLTLALVGCKSDGDVRIEYKNVPVPVYVVPQPPVITRPKLATESLTPAQRQVPGEVLKAERAAAAQLHGYIQQLELFYNTSGSLAKTSAGILERLKVVAPPPLELNDESKQNWVELMEDSEKAATPKPNE